MSTVCHRGRMKSLFWTAAAIVAVVAAAWGLHRANAQEHAEPYPGDAVRTDGHGRHDHGSHHDNPLAEVPFELHVNLAQAYASPLGEMAMELVREAKPNIDELIDGVADTLGMDPRTELGAITLRGEGMNEMDLELIVDLGETTGNLEGFMLTLPGYDSKDLDDNTLLHTFMIDDNPQHEHADHEVAEGHDGRKVHRVWAAMPKGEDGRHVLVASFSRKATTELAQQAQVGTLESKAPALGENDVISLRVDDLDEHGLPQGAPGSAVLESVQTVAMRLGSGEDVTADLSMETTTPARAKQVSQLLNGMIALGQLAALEAPEAQPLADFLGHVNVELNDQGPNPTVSASFRASQEKFQEWLEFLMENAN